MSEGFTIINKPCKCAIFAPNRGEAWYRVLSIPGEWPGNPEERAWLCAKCKKPLDSSHWWEEGIGGFKHEVRVVMG